MIIKYNTEIDNSYRTIIVKEKEIEYGVDLLSMPYKVVSMLNEVFKMESMAEEYCYLLCMNNNSRVIGIFEIGHGTVNTSIVSTRDVFMKALMVGAGGIVIAHNHPSGDPSPSEKDMLIFEKMKQASTLLNVELLDFIIVGRNQYLSFKEQNL